MNSHKLYHLPFSEVGGYAGVLSVRACNHLANGGIVTVDELLAIGERDIWNIRGIGGKMLDEVLHLRVLAMDPLFDPLVSGYGGA